MADELVLRNAGENAVVEAPRSSDEHRPGRRPTIVQLSRISDDHGYSDASFVIQRTELSPRHASVGEKNECMIETAGDDGERDLPPVDTGRKAWSFCFASFVMETMIWGWGFSYGVFQEYYSTHAPFDSSPAIAISAVGTVSIALTYMTTIPVMLFCRRYPHLIKTSMWIGLFFCVAALLVSSFAKQLWQLILLQGVVFGIAACVVYVPIMFWLPDWFVKRRGLAGGLVMGGSGLGGFVFPLVMNALLNKVGFRWTLRVWALVLAVLCGVSLLGVHPRKPVPKYVKGQERPKIEMPEMTFFKLPVFWMFSLTNLTQALSFFPVSLYLTVFASSFASSVSATAVLSVFNIACIVGQVAMGYLCDKMPYPWVMFGSMTGSALAAFLLWGFTSNLGQIFGFAILFGTLNGGFASVWQPAATDCAGSKSELQPFVFGANASVKGIAAIVGPIISGIILKAGKGTNSFGGGYGRFGFGPMEIFVGSFCAATAVGSVILQAMRTMRVGKGT